MRYFPEGVFTRSAFDSAEVAAKAVLEEGMNFGRADHWDVAYGSSGTVGAVAEVIRLSGRGEGEITSDGLDWLRQRLLASGSADAVRLEGLKDDRRPVIGGGVTVLRAIFDLLGVEQMQVAQGALRHGALYDLLDRENTHTDVRSATVDRLAKKFEADPMQAARVGRVAEHFWQQLYARDSSSETARHARKLAWAAQLFEIGNAISHEDAHKHGAYILDNSDAPGFAEPELRRLGLLVLGHRGKLRKLEADLTDEVLVQQLVCLRLAVILCHARRDPELNGLQLTEGARQFTLRVPAAWAARHPQSTYLLREEALLWQKTPWTFGLA
jgi:exopolyphosphatase/guanosine-5'-triphosphate,3'-diphosphate pyrophosphatase